jgi:aminobenzoyl-glutamate utilization protein A
MTDRSWLRRRRREFHHHPEPAWCEFYTLARIVDELEAIGVDDLLLGREVFETDARMGVPDPETRRKWRDRAADAGASPDTLSRLDGGFTGAIAVIGDGSPPVVGLRVDIDGVPCTESTDDAHTPAAEGFRSENEGMMHACGHDAHATMGLGVVRSVRDRLDAGTLKVLFQPAEEVLGAGKAIAEAGHFDDVEYLFVPHVGVDQPTGTVVCGVHHTLAIDQFEVTFRGESAHSGKTPQSGSDAIRALATATEKLHGIARHADGATRVNVGVIEGGSAPNVVAERASLEGEVRGETTPLRDYMRSRAAEVVAHAATLYGCECDVETLSEAPRVDSDPALAELVGDVARQVDGVDEVRPDMRLDASDDATYLMDRVSQRGGAATYLVLGTNHPGGHHTSTFDVDEDTLPVGVNLLSSLVRTATGSDA